MHTLERFEFALCEKLVRKRLLYRRRLRFAYVVKNQDQAPIPLFLSISNTPRPIRGLSRRSTFGMPNRVTALPPRAAKAFLPYLRIFDALDDGHAIRARLVGTAIVRMLKEDATGQRYEDASPLLVVRRVLRARGKGLNRQPTPSKPTLRQENAESAWVYPAAPAPYDVPV